MAITPSFVCSQSIGQPSIISILDDSSGSDIAITSRQVFLLTSTGEYLVPSGTATDYISWALATNPLSMDVLQTDMALSVKVNWLNISGSILYTKTIVYSFTEYSEGFLYSLTQNQVADNNITQDSQYYLNKMILRVLVDDANQAVSYASDYVTAQNSLNKAALMVQNESYFY